MSSANRLVSVDIETTGLDVGYHEPWEIAVVPFDVSKQTLHYQTYVDKLDNAEAGALQVGKFYDRYSWPIKALYSGHEVHYAHDMSEPSIVGEGEDAQEYPFTVVPAYTAARNVAEALDGATLLGMSVHFDANFLDPWLRAYGFAPSWSHRYLDLGSFAAGAWAATIPLSSKAISDRVPNPDAHNAFADATWNLEVYRSIVGSQVM